MEWIIGGFVLALLWVFISDATKNVNFSLIGATAAIILWIGFGLAVEIRDNLSQAFMKIENGVVVETEKRIIVVWSKPKNVSYALYDAGEIMFAGEYYSSYSEMTLNYKIYCRVEAENLEKAQKYYDEVILKRNNNLKATEKELEKIIKSSKEKKWEKALFKTAADYLKEFGLKITNIDFIIE